MEAAIIGVIGRIAPLLFGFLKGKYNLVKGLEENIRSITNEFNMICAILAGAGDHPRQSSDEKHMEWIKIVRDLARDIEDCIDHFKHGVHHKISTVTSSIEFAKEIEILKKRSGEAGELIVRYNTKKRSVETGEQMERYTTGGGSRSSTLELGTPEPPILADTAAAVGMDAARRELMELISEAPQDQPKKLKVISIVGFGGIGKSQLADYAYKTIDESEYPEKAWVHAAGKGTRDVLKEIHRQLRKNSTSSSSSGGLEDDTNNLNTLRTRVHQYLDNKRFFIVIDGLETSDWDNIEDALPLPSGVSSRVIVTTDTHSIATKCSALDGHIYEMQSLNKKDSRELFFKKAKLHFPPEPDDTKLGSQVIEKCDGLPLALVTTARVLRGNPTEEEWADLGKNLAEYMEKNDVLVNMQHVLDRTYMRLCSEEIKTCLLYLGIYPNGHPIRTTSLIRKWLAEGFIKENPNTKVSSFKVAVRNFNELVNQSIIQPIIDVTSSNNSTVVKKCQTHRMMLEFILHKSMYQNFVTLLYDKDPPHGSKIRWLSLQYNPCCKMVPEDLPLVRSLTIFGKAHNSLLDFKKYKLMKVLDLEECGVEMGDSHLKDICSNLVLLRYLSLGATVKVTALPKEIAMLMLLETLDVRRTKIEILPTQVLELPCLVHLFGKLKLQGNCIVERAIGKVQTLLPGSSKSQDNAIGDQKLKEVQAWLSKNSKLETLAGFVVDESQQMPQLIEHMENLTKVKIWCKSSPSSDKINHLKNAIKGFIERGTRCDNAPSLSLNFNTEWRHDLLYLKLKNDRVYYLRSLKLQGNKICSTLPWFITKLGGLTKLCLSFPRHKLSTEFLADVIKVPRLEYLKLVANELDNLVISKDALKSLRRLCVVVEVLTGLEIEKGALPRLESLWLLCKDLNGFSGTTIQSLLFLQEVTLHNGLSYQAKQDWRKEAKEHRRRPKVLFAKTELIRSESAVKIRFVAPATDTTAEGVAMPANAIPTQESGDGQHDDREKKDDSKEFAPENGSNTGTECSEMEIEGEDQQMKDDTRIHKPINSFREEPPHEMEWTNTMLETSNVNDTPSHMFQHTPLPRTRPRSPTSENTCSPSKLRKNNVPEDFVGHVTSEGSITTEGDEIAAIMEEVVKCGASEVSDEHYMATKLFDIPANRSFFYSMKTSEGRLNWLKRQYDDSKRN